MVIQGPGPTSTPMMLTAQMRLRILSSRLGSRTCYGKCHQSCVQNLHLWTQSGMLLALTLLLHHESFYNRRIHCPALRP